MKLSSYSNNSDQERAGVDKKLIYFTWKIALSLVVFMRSCMIKTTDWPQNKA